MKSNIIILSLLVALVVPGLVIAAVNDTQFGEQLTNMRENHEAFKEARRQAASEIRADNQAAVELRLLELEEKRDVNRQTVLIKIVDIQLAYFERVLERVNRMPNIDETLKSDLAAQINSALTTIGGLKTEIAGAADAEALKALATTIKDTFKSLHETVKDIVEAIHSSRVANVEIKAGDRSSAIAAKLAELASEGKDVTTLEALLSEADALLVEAATLREAGENKEAVDKIKAAYALYRQIAQDARQL